MPAPRCASAPAATRIYGSMRMLADQKDEALELLRLAVEQPRFDQAPIDRIRAQIVVRHRRRRHAIPETAAQVAWAKALYGDHPYARQDEGTRETLATITPDDLQALPQAGCSRATICMSAWSARSMPRR